MSEERLKILQVEDKEALFVGKLEGDVQDALLRVVEVHQARQQERPHLGDRGADRVPLLAEEVPEDHRRGGELVFRGEADRLGALLKEILRLARLGDAGKIAFHVGAEHRHARLREPLGHDLQRHRLAGAGCAGDEAMTIAEWEEDVFRLGARSEIHLAFFQ